MRSFKDDYLRFMREVVARATKVRAAKIEDARITIPIKGHFSFLPPGEVTGWYKGEAKAKVEVLVDGKWWLLFTYYHHEVQFGPEEFEGLTVEEGQELFTRKAVA